MTNPDHFSIRERSLYDPDELRCPVCDEDVGRASYYVNAYNEPLCRLCGWEKAPNLSNLLHLGNAACQFHDGGPPPNIRQELEKRADDPKRLKKELQEALEFLDNHGHGDPVTSPLTKFVMGQVKAALKSKNIETMKEARGLVEETRRGVPMLDLDDELPF